MITFTYMAEGVGFEPTSDVSRCRFSRPVPSTARPPLRSSPFHSIRSWRCWGVAVLPYCLDRVRQFPWRLVFRSWCHAEELQAVALLDAVLAGEPAVHFEHV